MTDGSQLRLLVTNVKDGQRLTVNQEFLFANSEQNDRLKSMSVEQLESQIMALPLAERRALTRWLDEHRDEIEQPSVLSRAQETEVQRRLAEMEADPTMRVPFDEKDVEQMFKEIMNERAAKASTRSR